MHSIAPRAPASSGTPAPSSRPPRSRRKALSLAIATAVAALAACTAERAGPPPAPATVAVAPAPALTPPTAPAAVVATAPAAAPGATTASPADDAALQQAFVAWREEFRKQARSQGISEGTLAAALDVAHLQPLAIDRDRTQPEFTRAVWDYLDSAVSPQRVTRGQEKLQQVRKDADRAAARFGVPATVIAAIWGMESNYGGNFGDIPTVDALATLGFEGRRRDWARGELLAALKIIDSGDIDRQHMLGSWAGAMGHTQFLPSSFLAYAVDADGDGRRDIWGSTADVMASTANYLARAGWQAGQPWGTEVVLPAGFDYRRADTSVRQTSAGWSAEGLRSTGGGALPDLGDAYVLLPAGARGPAFLVGPNFRAILRYNNSTSYALAVGLLAQRLDGGTGVSAAWPRELGTLGRSQVRELQTLLQARGLATGTPDGMMGPATREAVRQYQIGAALPADGYPTAQLLEQLRQR